MENRQHLLISFIGIFIVSILFSPVSYAEEDLDTLHQDFLRTYDKGLSHQLYAAQNKHDQASIHDRRILVKTTAETTFEAESFGVKRMDGYDSLRANDIHIVHVPEEMNYSKKLDELNRAKGVIHAEPDYFVEQMNSEEVPEDPLFHDQWYLQDIDLLKAWEISQGSKDVTIAIIDSGVQADHPDLSDRVQTGYDFVNYTKGGNKDTYGHGTHVAGIIGANANDIGVVGIDQAASILPIRAMGDEGTGSIAGEIDGIYYAIDQDADIINMSYVIEEKNELENEALWDAYDAGIVLVASAGNYSTEKPMYPGSYPQVMNVSSTTKKDELALFSNYGIGIDLAAPGEDIHSTALNNGYMSDDGTSFSAPIVSGIAGLVKAAHPEWEANEIRYALESGSRSLKGLEWDYYFGYGKVDAYQALMEELPEQKDKAGSTSQSAKEVKSGKQIKGNMDMPLETNWYTFTIPENADVTIDITNHSTHADLVGALYKETEGTMEQEYVIDDTSMGGNEQLMEKLSAGTYQLAISDFHGRWSEKPYYLQIDYTDGERTQRPYPDVSFYKEEIHFLRDEKIIRGFSDGEFKPKHDIARLQALRMILHEKGIDANENNAPNPQFTDVKPGEEGYEAIATAVDLGIIKGKDDHTFDRWGSLTRAQMAAMMKKAYGFTGTSDVEFTDVDEAHWAYEPIQALVANDIANGYPDHTFQPYAPLTRQHFAVLMYKKMTLDK